MPEWVASLPAVNAGLNALATVLLVAGYAAVKTRRLHLHRNLMLSCFAVSTAFLGCYLVYHYYAHATKFPSIAGWRWVSWVYYVILATHVVLATAVPVLAVLTIRRAFQGRFEAHRRIARITFPIWLYVSVTGVVIYGMLYHLAPSLTAG